MVNNVNNKHPLEPICEGIVILYICKNESKICFAQSCFDPISENEVVGEAAFHSPTLPETNIAPENRCLEKEIPIGNSYF